MKKAGVTCVLSWSTSKLVSIEDLMHSEVSAKLFSVFWNLQPISSLTQDMDERSREMFVQLLLRNIRQMYYSRAYCEPRLQRFMIRASPPPPPPQPEAPSEPSSGASPEDSKAADTKVDGVRKLFRKNLPQI